MEYHRYDIGRILEHYGADPVTPDRGWHAVRCPFHGDRDASGSVNSSEHVFNCFVCEVRGSATQIIMKVEGVSYGEAVSRAEAITGDRNSEVRGKLGSRYAVSRETRHYKSYREIRDAWGSD